MENKFTMGPPNEQSNPHQTERGIDVEVGMSYYKFGEISHTFFSGVSLKTRVTQYTFISRDMTLTFDLNSENFSWPHSVSGSPRSGLQLYQVSCFYPEMHVFFIIQANYLAYTEVYM